jgi:PAS domain S-box-containing protein
MNDQDKTKQQLIAELEELRQRVGEQEVRLARSRQAEAEQRQINSSLPVLVATAGRDGYYKEVNAAFERILGWSEEESLSRPFLEFIHPEDRTRVMLEFERLRSGSPVTDFVDRNICKDGSHRWIRWDVIPVPGRDIVFGIGEDITEQRRAEDKLRASEARWRSVIESFPVQVGTVDRAGTILSLHGPEPGLTLENAIGRTVYEFLCPQYHEPARRCIEHIFRTGESVVTEAQALGPHGTVRWYENRLGPVKVNGEVVAITLVSSEIAERKRAEATLRESEERFRKVFEEGPLGMAIVGLDCQVKRVNRRLCDMLGYSEEDICSLGVIGLTHPGDIDDDRRLWIRLVRGEIPYYTIDERYMCKDGRTLWGHLTACMMHDAGRQPAYLIRMIEDITDRKRSEAALQASEAKYRRLYQGMMDAFVSVSMDGRIQEFNDAYREMLGYEPEELRALTYIDITPTRWHAFQAKLIHDQVLQRGYSDIYEKEYRRKDGTIVPVELRTYLVSDDNGQPAAMWAIMRDITQRKRAEHELKEAKDRLEDRVRERTAALTEANERLQAEVKQRRQAEEQLAIFRRFVESAAQGFGMADVEGRIIYVNPYLARLFGAERPADVIGKQVASFYPAGYLERREREIIPALRRGEPWQREQLMLFADGTLHPTIHSVFPVSDGNGELLYAAVAITDITELKRNAEALRQSESKYRALVESLPDAVAVVDLEGRIVFASQRAAEQHGAANPDELVGMNAVDLVIEEDRDRSRADIRRLIEEGVRRGDRYRMNRKDGTTFDAETSSAIIRDAAGNPIALMGICRDITERNRAEEELHAKDAEFLAAARIQVHLLPQEAPHLPGFDIAGYCYPAEIAAGDHFDYLWLADGSLLIVLGDVSGHGIASAIVAADFCARLRTLADTQYGLAEMAVRVNSGLYRETAGDTFVTAILGRLDVTSRSLTYVNAGHPPAIVLNSAGEVKARLARGGLPFAIVPETSFVSDGSVELATGDLVLFYTDGLVEVRRGNELQFGIDRAIQAIQANQDRTAAEIIEALYRAACHYGGQGKLDDDITMVVVKVLAYASDSSPAP